MLGFKSRNPKPTPKPLMTESQLQTLVGLYAGLHACLIEIVTALNARGAIDQKQLSQQLLSASQNRKPNEHNSALIALSLRQLAIGLSEGSSDTAEQIRALLH